jgi:hypothetical protein
MKKSISLVVFFLMVLFLMKTNASPAQLIYTTVLKTEDSLSNFECLIKSEQLKFLKRMNTQYDNQKSGFWTKSDTTKINARKTRIFRMGDCEDTTATMPRYENCRHHEYLTINVFKNKVIQYSVDNQSFSSIIEFNYNKKGELVRYIENGNLSTFHYDKNGTLIKVSMHELQKGEQQLIGIITFKERAVTNLK